MKTIKTKFEIPCKNDSGDENATLVLELWRNHAFLQLAKGETFTTITFTNEQLDSLENAFYAMYMLIRNSKD